MAKITLTGNLFIQMAGEAKPAPLPISVELDYTEKSITDYTWITDQTNLALNQGTVTAPRFVYIEVTEGSVLLSTSAIAAGAVKYAANPTPSSGDSTTRGFMFTYSPATSQFYVTTSGPTRAKFWFFE